MRSFQLFLMTLLVAVPCLVLGDGADKKVTTKGSKSKVESAKVVASAKKSAAKDELAVTAEQEAAATALVKEHHNDLFELLIHLKESLPNEYSRAIRDLSRASERLASFEKRDLARYKVELKLWQAQSRRQLITAKLQMGQDESLLNELRDTLLDEYQLSIEALRHERQRLAGRLAKLDEQLKSQEAGLEASVEKRFAALTRATKSAQRNASNDNRKTVTRKSTKDPT